MPSTTALSGDHQEQTPEKRDSMVVSKQLTENDNGSPLVADAQLSPSQLSYHLLRMSTRSARERKMLQEAYATWKRVWSATFNQLTGLERLHSDEFARQHEWVTLFDGERCIGLAGFRYVDLDADSTRDDSYFAIWPGYALDAARAWGRSACVVGNFVVVPEYRGRSGGFSIKEMLTILCMHRLSSSPACMALVTTRNDRGMSDVMYRFGAHRLVEKATLHGVSVDLAVFSRWGTKVALRHPELGRIVDQTTQSSSTRRIA